MTTQPNFYYEKKTAFRVRGKPMRNVGTFTKRYEPASSPSNGRGSCVPRGSQTSRSWRCTRSSARTSQRAVQGERVPSRRSSSSNSACACYSFFDAEWGVGMVRVSQCGVRSCVGLRAFQPVFLVRFIVSPYVRYTIVATATPLKAPDMSASIRLTVSSKSSIIPLVIGRWGKMYIAINPSRMYTLIL